MDRRMQDDGKNVLILKNIAPKPHDTAVGTYEVASTVSIFRT